MSSQNNTSSLQSRIYCSTL